MTRRIITVIGSLAGAALLAAGLTACLESDSGADAPSDATPWDGPTDGVWGESVSKDAYVIGFEEPWEIDYSDYRIRVVGAPTYGPLSSYGTVDVIGTFEVTKTRETNDSPSLHMGWMEGVRPENDDEAVPRPKVTCENEELAVGETTTCTGVVSTDKKYVENSSWRFGMHDVAAFPGQTLENIPD